MRVVYFGLGQVFAGDARHARRSISYRAVEPVRVAGVLVVDPLRLRLGVEVRAVVVAVGGQRRHAGRARRCGRAWATAGARRCGRRGAGAGEEGVFGVTEAVQPPPILFDEVRVAKAGGAVPERQES